MPKLQKLADLTPGHLDARLASNEATSPLVPHLEKEILAMITDGHWDTYPIRLIIIGANDEPSLHLRLGARRRRQRGALKLYRYYETFSRFSYDKAFPEFVERVARLKLPDTLTVKITPGGPRESPILVIDKA